jgi:polysaccharide biosynthesis protein PslG
MNKQLAFIVLLLIIVCCKMPAQDNNLLYNKDIVMHDESVMNVYEKNLKTLVPIGHVKSRNSEDIENSPWGIQIGTLEAEHLQKARKIGIKWTRLNASWNEIEKTKGVYYWGATDTAFNIALENGITPFVCLLGSNKLYCKEDSKSPTEKEIYGAGIEPPTKDSVSFEGWLRFVKAAVEHYKDKIIYWEIWNEPNHPHYWGAAPDGKEYGKMVRETAKIIKSVKQDAFVLAGALAGLDPDFTDKFLSGGAAKLINAVTFHNYGEIPEERIYKAVEEWSVINKYNSSLQLWQGECGYPSHSSTRDYRGTGPWGDFIQAKWLLRQSFTDVFFCKTTISNYFKLVHSGGRGEMPKREFLTQIDSLLGFPSKGGSRVKSVGVNEKCILENPDLTPKPAYFAYQNLCAVFDGRYKVNKIQSNTSIIDAGIFHGIGKEDDAFPSIPLVSTFKSEKNNWLIAYWLPWHPQEIISDAEIDLSLTGAAFKNPVLVDLLDGKVFSLNNYQKKQDRIIFRNIPMADYPYIIVERDQIEVEQ